MTRRRSDLPWRAQFADFEAWLLERGLSTETVDVYVRDLETARRAGGIGRVRPGAGLLARLRSDEIAPKTKRHILAAARHWADFHEDTKLGAALNRLRLPPARRVKAKVPMQRAELFALLDELRAAKDLNPPVRAVIGMMAARGLRLGDVLRLTRQEIDAAIATGVLAYEAKGRRRLEFKVLKTYRPFLAQLAASPGAWARVSELVSPQAKTGKRRASAASRAVERALTRLGVRAGIFGLHPHRLRRTYAVEYLRGMTGDPEAVVKLTQHMQWAEMSTALEYVDHARGDELDGVAERMFER